MRILWRWLPSTLALLAGVGLFMILLATRPRAERTSPPPQAIPVSVEFAEKKEHPLKIRAYGTVVPAREVVIQPELTGRVVWQNEAFSPGGLVRAGEPLIRIDTEPFRAAIKERVAQVAAARVQFQLETQRAVVAQKEWALLGNKKIKVTDQGRALSLRDPQRKSAAAALAASEALLRQAKWTLKQTQLVAPFDAVIRTRNVDVGQLVSSGTQLATLVGTEDFWVQVSLPMKQIDAIDIPGVTIAATEPGSRVKVIQTTGNQEHIRHGRVVRLLSDLDKVGRMARVLVELEDPLGLRAAPDSKAPRGLPLFLGAYVSIEIDAGSLQAYEVPRSALRTGNIVWVVDEDTLKFRTVQIGWRTEETVLVNQGLQAGEAIIVSDTSVAVEGMKVRIVDDATPNYAARGD